LLEGCVVPKAFPLEFRRDVVAVARKSEESNAKIAKSLGELAPIPQTGSVW
jgi:hypothetical protein